MNDKYSNDGLNQHNLDKLYPNIKKLSDSELQIMYRDAQKQLEQTFLREIDRGQASDNNEVMEKSQFLDILINEMYYRGIV